MGWTLDIDKVKQNHTKVKKKEGSEVDVVLFRDRRSTGTLALKAIFSNY